MNQRVFRRIRRGFWFINTEWCWKTSDTIGLHVPRDSRPSLEGQTTNGHKSTRIGSLKFVSIRVYSWFKTSRKQDPAILTVSARCGSFFGEELIANCTTGEYSQRHLLCSDSRGPVEFRTGHANSNRRTAINNAVNRSCGR